MFIVLYVDVVPAVVVLFVVVVYFGCCRTEGNKRSDQPDFIGFVVTIYSDNVVVKS